MPCDALLRYAVLCYATPWYYAVQEDGFGWQGYPVAKMFGQLLNLNCSLLMLPVIRSLVRWMHDLTSISGPAWYATLRYAALRYAALRYATLR